MYVFKIDMPNVNEGKRRQWGMPLQAQIHKLAIKIEASYQQAWRKLETAKQIQFSLSSKFPRMDLQAKQDPEVQTP